MNLLVAIPNKCIQNELRIQFNRERLVLIHPSIDRYLYFFNDYSLERRGFLKVILILNRNHNIFQRKYKRCKIFIGSLETNSNKLAFQDAATLINLQQDTKCFSKTI